MLLASRSQFVRLDPLRSFSIAPRAKQGKTNQPNQMGEMEDRSAKSAPRPLVQCIARCRDGDNGEDFEEEIKYMTVPARYLYLGTVHVLLKGEGERAIDESNPRLHRYR